MTREQKITLTGTIIIIGFFLSVFYHYAAGVYQNLAYPFNTFLFRPEDRFMDFVWPYTISADPYQVARPDFQNFPALYRVVSFFTLLPLPVAQVLFMLLFITGFFLICRWQVKVADRFASLQNTIIFTFLSYPFLFALDRQNLEILVFFCVYLFVFTYHKRPIVSAVLLGMAIAIKAFPVVLAILLLSDRRYKELLVAAATALAATMLSYLSFPGGLVLNITNHLHNLGLYNANYVSNLEGLYFGNSIFGAITFVSLPFHPDWIQGGVPQSFATGYTIAILITLILLTAYVIFVEKIFWKKVTLLICALNLFPLVSADYKLLHLFIPLFLFLNEAKTERPERLTLILFGLLLIPKDYFHLPALPEASISIVLNPLLMLLLVATLIITRQPRSESSQPPTAAGAGVKE